MNRLMGELRGWDWGEILITLALIAASWLVARTLVAVVSALCRRWNGRDAGQLGVRVLAASLRPIARLMVLGAATLLLHRYHFGLLGLLDELLFVAGMVVVVHLGIRVLSVFLRWYGARLNARSAQEHALPAEMIPLADRLGRVFLVLVGALAVMNHYQIDVRSILVTLGVGSLAIGLALQDTLANMFGGLAILLDRPFRVGDRIQLQSGEVGDVVEIGIRSTRIHTPEDHVVIVPNSLLVRTIVSNHSYPDPRVQLQCEVALHDPRDVAAAREILLACARRDGVDSQPAPLVQVRSISEASPRMVLIAHLSDYRNRGRLYDEISTQALEEFGKRGIHLSSPNAMMVLPQGPAGTPEVR